MDWRFILSVLHYMWCKPLGKTLLLTSFLVFFCEVLIYYIVLLQCTWPQISSDYTPLKTALLADTHLLGPRFGHWFDKLRREWQMYRTFQTMMAVHNPKAVFILGDIFDEGQHSIDHDFDAYVRRFHQLFYVSSSTDLFVVAGNHDIGFHYRVTRKLSQRFSKAFNMSSVEMLTLEGNTFVLINSMAMEGDGCFLCKPAEEKLNHISEILRCSKGDNSANCDKVKKLPQYSKPVVLQHFPLFRPSDIECKEPDVAPTELIGIPFRESLECLSKESSEKLLDLLEPRAVFTGHTHHGCLTVHRAKIPEWTISSFSWRNKKNPSFLLAVFTPDNFAVSKCHMPNENTVILLYIAGGIVIFLWLLFSRRHLKSL